MDIEDLSTTQIILLALLVSFVTSIATGIVTVSLLSQAPPAVTNTVNQIVERTIETVVPQESGGTVTQTVKETTVVVKEDDLITDSISGALGKAGRVHSGIATTSSVVGLAAPLGGNMLITASSVVDKEHLVTFGGSQDVYTVRDRYPSVGIAVLVPKSASTTVATTFRVGDAGALKLGQTVIALVSVTAERVSIGAVSAKSALADVPVKDKDPVSVRVIDTNINAALVPGAPLVNIFGDVVGIYTAASEAAGKGAFAAISDAMPLLVAPAATSTPVR